MPDIIHFARTGKGIVIHCAFKEDYSADSADLYPVILPKFMGVMGIYRAEPIADVISVLTTSAVFIITVKKVLRNM